MESSTLVKIVENTLSAFIANGKPLIDFLHKNGGNELKMCGSDD